MSNPFQKFNLDTLDGNTLDAEELADRTILIVNVASKCGLTPQYDGLARLHREADNREFMVVGVPCNQFGGQEPGGPEEILSFCSSTYGVDFPLLAKRDVNGVGRAPLYEWLVSSPAGGGADIEWNFGKFLVHKGRVVRRFAPTVAPDDGELLDAIADLIGD